MTLSMILVLFLISYVAIADSYLGLGYVHRSSHQFLIPRESESYRRKISARNIIRYAAENEDDGMEGQTRDAEEDTVPKGQFKISKQKNELINFSPPSNVTPSPLSSQLIIVGGTMGLLAAAVLFFIFINKDVPVFESKY